MYAIPERSPQRIDVSAERREDHRDATRGRDRHHSLRDDPVCVDDVGAKRLHGATYCEPLGAEQCGNLDEVSRIRAGVLEDRAGGEPFPPPWEVREALDAHFPLAARSPGRWERVAKHERLEMACLVLGEIAHEGGVPSPSNAGNVDVITSRRRSLMMRGT